MKALQSRALYHGTETIENSLCWVIRGYFSGTTQGNQNDLYVVYKDGGMKDLTGSVFPYFQVVESMKFGKPDTLVVTGKVLSADKTALTAASIEIDIHTGKPPVQ